MGPHQPHCSRRAAANPKTEAPGATQGLELATYILCGTHLPQPGGVYHLMDTPGHKTHPCSQGTAVGRQLLPQNTHLFAGHTCGCCTGSQAFGTSQAPVWQPPCVRCPFREELPIHTGAQVSSLQRVGAVGCRVQGASAAALMSGYPRPSE